MSEDTWDTKCRVRLKSDEHVIALLPHHTSSLFIYFWAAEMHVCHLDMAVCTGDLPMFRIKMNGLRGQPHLAAVLPHH